jgi:predicted aspartyl protease
LGLLYRHRGRAILADGGQVFFDIYDVAVLWDGEPRDIRVGVGDATPLVGMRLLDRHNLNIDVEDGGRVVIQAKSS